MRPAPIAAVRGWTCQPHAAQARLGDTVAAIACGGFGLSLRVLPGGFFTLRAIQLMEH
jgi:hypothetical protein